VREVHTLSEASPEFKQLLRDAFEAIDVGQTYTFRRTFTDGDAALF
jgi:3-hydroxybutyryl-CoA dehydratase